MHHHAVERGVVIGPILADPEEIAFRLLLERNSRPGAGVTEKEITDA